MSEIPVIIHKKSTHPSSLECSFQQVPVSIVNGIRRTILSEIPCFVFNGFPSTENNIHIHKNTSRINNEILKQRISCIPVHLTDFTIPYQDVEFSIEVSNTTNSIIHVTTDDIKVRYAPEINEEGTTPPPQPELLAKVNPTLLFPHDPITKSPIVITKLKAKINDELPGEEVHLTAKLSISSAKHNGCYNVVSTCSYSNTVDDTNANLAWEQSIANITFESTEEEKTHQENWMLLEGKRHFKANCFEFIIESLGIYENNILMKTACKIMVEQFAHIQQLDQLTIKDSHSTIENGKDVILNVDYSIGKLLEHYVFHIHRQHITYISFFKTHPHDDDSILRIAIQPDSEHSLETMISSTSGTIIDILDKISKSF